MLQQTSLEAYQDIKINISQRQKEILVYLIAAGKPLNNKMLSQISGLPINCVTPRVKELRDKGIIIKSHTAKCPYTGKSSYYWRYFK